jgi:UDP-N-acetylglucosamine 2-epimerase (non-hydrolysing)
VTGNPVVDALLWTLERLRGSGGMWEEKYAFLGDRHVVLITGHRRESFGHGFENICAAIRQLSMKFPQVEFVYPVHPNPQVRQPVCDRLGDCQNIHLVAPAPYPEFVWLMERAAVILTDSGGVEEESPTLRKPVVVMRRATDRQEIVRVGAGLLVGTRPERIVSAVSRLLTDREAYRFMQVERNPYGDGQAAVRIVDRMLDRPWLRDGAARHRPAPPEVARRRKTAGTQRPLAQRHSGLRRPQLRRARRS